VNEAAASVGAVKAAGDEAAAASDKVARRLLVDAAVARGIGMAMAAGWYWSSGSLQYLSRR
jgi:hypothetical protein